MCKILLFGGTTEGRELAEYLSGRGISLTVCVATDYGEEVLAGCEGINIIAKRLNQDEMEALIRTDSYTLIIDATHPYAVQVTENLIKACERTEVKYLRLLRETISKTGHDAVFVEDTKACTQYLQSTSGNIFLTVGSKELKAYSELAGFKERVFARVLPMPEVIKECSELGLCGRHLIGMQGPFSEDLNYAMLKDTGAVYMVTKDTGKEGGFAEKLRAAERAGVKTVVVGRPAKEEGLRYEEVIKYLNEYLNLTEEVLMPKRNVYLVGIGAGTRGSLTLEGEQVFQNADIIIGAKRMLAALSCYDKPTAPIYKKDEIIEYLKNNPKYQTIAIALSGDVGFYSGAKNLVYGLEQEGCKVMLVPGISSIVYFASKLQVSWEDAGLCSLHGRDFNIISKVNNHRKCFVLMGGKWTLKALCTQLSEYGLNRVILKVGEHLSYSDERITSGTPEELLCSPVWENEETSPLSVVYIENLHYTEPLVTHGLLDSVFVRGDAPMTKSEVRSISLSKMELHKDDIVYDIGAGTGSVAVEAGLLLSEGRVYAIEKNEEALKLIDINRRRHRTANVHIVQGTAPEVMEELPPPDCVFIGGTSGNMESVIHEVLNKNAAARIVINVITLESLSEVLKILKNIKFINYEIVQVMVSKSRQVGDYNMMLGQNPVYIISCEGAQDYEQIS